MEKIITDAMNESVLKEGSTFYHYNPDMVTDLHGFENFVYGYDDMVIRFVHSAHRTYELVLAEIEFIDYLDHSGASVSTLIQSKSGNLVERIELDNNHYFSVMAFTKAKGTFLTKEQFTDDLFYLLGKEIAKLHLYTKDYTPKHKRHEWFEEDYITSCKPYLTKEDQNTLNKSVDIFHKIQSIPKTTNNYGLIHTDLHFHNMYYENGIFTFFDFDDSSYKYFMSDIAIVLYYYFVFNHPSITDRITETKRILTPFMKGYNEINLIPKEDWKHLNDFLKLRETVLFLVLKADMHGKETNPGMLQLVTQLQYNIDHDIPFYHNLEFLDEIIK